MSLPDPLLPPPERADLASAVDLVLATIVHEVRRASRRPVFAVTGSEVATGQQAALAFGWLRPSPADRRLLSITHAGRAALRDAEALQLFPRGMRQIGREI